MSEQEFSAWLRQRLDGHVCRIENTIGNGMPDINWCYAGHEIWVETKVEKNGRTLLEPEQQAWAARRTRAGGIVIIVTDYGNTIKVWDMRKPQELILRGKYMSIESQGVIIGKRSFTSSLLAQILGIQ